MVLYIYEGKLYIYNRSIPVTILCYGYNIIAYNI